MKIFFPYISPLIICLFCSGLLSAQPADYSIPPESLAEVQKHLAHLGMKYQGKLSDISQLSPDQYAKAPDNVQGAVDDGAGEQGAILGRAMPQIANPFSSCAEWKPVSCWCYMATKFDIYIFGVRIPICIILNTNAQEYRHPATLLEAGQTYQSSTVPAPIMAAYRQGSAALATNSNFMANAVFPLNLLYAGVPPITQTTQASNELKLESVPQEYANYGDEKLTAYSAVSPILTRRAVKRISETVPTPIRLPRSLKPSIQGCININIYEDPKLYSVHDTKTDSDTDPGNWYISVDTRNFIRSYIPQLTPAGLDPWGQTRPFTAHSYNRDPRGRRWYDVPKMFQKAEPSRCLRKELGPDSGDHISPQLLPLFAPSTWSDFDESTEPCLYYRNGSSMPMWQINTSGWNAINNGAGAFKAALAASILKPNEFAEISFKRPDALPHKGKDLVQLMKGPHFEDAGLTNSCGLLEKPILEPGAGAPKAYNDALMLTHPRSESSELAWKWVKGFPRREPWASKCNFDIPAFHELQVPYIPIFKGWIDPFVPVGCYNFHYGK